MLAHFAKTNKETSLREYMWTAILFLCWVTMLATSKGVPSLVYVNYCCRQQALYSKRSADAHVQKATIRRLILYVADFAATTSRPESKILVSQAGPQKVFTHMSLTRISPVYLWAIGEQNKPRLKYFLAHWLVVKQFSLQEELLKIPLNPFSECILYHQRALYTARHLNLISTWKSLDFPTLIYNILEYIYIYI